MQITKAEFKCSSERISQVPKDDLKDIAFIGRSNVGKSSLINMLTARTGLAKVSGTPGKTRLINHFRINDAWYLVDLPGYGYAKVSQETKAKWGKMIENYLHTSAQLKCVFLLIDIRHEPSANDRDMYDWIVYNGFHPLIIATKADKINRSQLSKQVKLIRTALDLDAGTTVIPFSAETKQGRDDIYARIDQLLSGTDL